MDGTEYTQSLALLKYAGKLGGLYPEDALAALKVTFSRFRLFGVDCREPSRFPLPLSLTVGFPSRSCSAVGLRCTARHGPAAQLVGVSDPPSLCRFLRGLLCLCN